MGAWAPELQGLQMSISLASRSPLRHHILSTFTQHLSFGKDHLALLEVSGAVVNQREHELLSGLEMYFTACVFVSY